MRLPHRHREAIKEGGNLVGLSLAVALSAATLNPLPLLVGLVAEAAYLLFVPDTKWYENHLSRKHDAEIERRRAALKAQILPRLSPETRERYLRLETVRAEIAAHPPDERLLIADSGWFREVLRKLDYLLDKFLQFAQKEVQFRVYLQSVLEDVRADGRPPTLGRTRDGVAWVADPKGARRGGREDRERERGLGARGASSRGRSEEAEPSLREHADPGLRWVARSVDEVEQHYERDLEGIRLQLAANPDASTCAVLEKRIAILERRREFIGKLGRILTNLTQQLHLLEDTFGLINDEIRARPPEQVLADIEDVVVQTQTMTDVLEEVGPMEQMMARLSGDMR